MEQVVEALSWMPFAVGVLGTMFTVGALIHLVTRHVFARGHSLVWRLEAVILVVGFALIPLATAGYRYPTWHAAPAARAAEVLFGAALVGLPIYGFAATRRNRDPDAARSTERVPGQGSLLQVALLAVVSVGAGVAFVGHGLDVITPTL